MIEELKLLHDDQIEEVIAWAKFVRFRFPDNLDSLKDRELEFIKDECGPNFLEQYYDGFV
jgi:hypothetical protein